MSGRARKVVLPRYAVTETTDEGDPKAWRVHHPSHTSYFVRARTIREEPFRRHKKVELAPTIFEIYPLVLQGNGVPWDEANLFIFSRLEEKPFPKMTTFSSQAEDLAAYYRFLEEENIDWRNFPAHKSKRPTYRFRNYLTHDVWAGKLAPTTAKRRLGVVIRFYRWLIEEKMLELDNPPWKEREAFIQTKGSYGQVGSIKIKTTDIGINIRTQRTEYDEYIYDSGKLRPLSQQEQEWLLVTLHRLGNTEMTLIHMLALLCGARMQTALTFRVRHAQKEREAQPELIHLIGPGTGIDTKNSKRQLLHVPIWLQEKLSVYANSERARKRRERSGYDSPDQYLFLSVRGAPMYASAQGERQDTDRLRKYTPRGQAVRQYMTDYIIPAIRKEFDPSFSYQFHDLRATFGMNMVDEMSGLITRGEMSYARVLDFVRSRMGHESPSTTERYLKYRANLQLKRTVQDGWEARLKSLVTAAIKGC